MKNKRRKTAAERTASGDALAMMLRNGGGTHGDRRTKRARTRSAQRSIAIRDAVSW